MGNRSKKFTFTLTLTEDGTTPLDKVKILRVNGENGEAEEIELKDGVYEFELSHDERIVFEIPKGTKYKIVETNEGYEVSYTVKSGEETQGTTKQDAVAEGTLSDDTTVTFTNKLEVPVPTGVHLRAEWAALVMLMGLAGVAGVLRKRRGTR